MHICLRLLTWKSESQSEKESQREIERSRIHWFIPQLSAVFGLGPALWRSRSNCLLRLCQQCPMWAAVCVPAVLLPVHLSADGLRKASRKVAQRLGHLPHKWETQELPTPFQSFRKRTEKRFLVLADVLWIFATWLYYLYVNRLKLKLISVRFF